MKAVLLRVPGGPDALEVVELPTPEPLPGQVLVQAQAIGVGRPDVMIRTGKYKWMPPLPAVIGNEMCGVVAVLGQGVGREWLGRQVLVSARELDTRGGCYAEQMVLPVESLIALPDGLDAAHAVCLPNYQLAWGLLHDATRGRLPRSVYLNGAAGGVGSALIDLCQQLGITVIAGAGSEEKRRFALSLGARAAVDTSVAAGAEMPAHALAQQILDATAGRGVDVAYDHVCGPHVGDHLAALAPFGLLVSYNALRGLPGQDVFAALRGHASHAPGIVTYNMHAYDGDRDARRALLRTPMEWMAQGRLRPKIDRTLPISGASEAHRLLDARSVLGKLVLLPDH